MHAYIITGGSADERSDHINKLLNKQSVSPHDVVTIAPTPTSIGVDSVRGVGLRLSIHPIASPCHAVIIRDAQTMTLEAQNAFLKTLEEPPGSAIIILETGQPDALLPTILSRCQLVTLGNTSNKQNKEEILQCIDTLKSLEEQSIGSQLKKIDELAKTRDNALAFVNLAIAALHDELTNHGVHSKLRSNEITKLLRSSLTAHMQLSGNVNPKLVLDHMLL